MMNEAIMSAANALLSLPYLRKSETSVLAKRAKGWELGLPAYAEVPKTPLPVVIAVGGGKGGVGKSLVSANLCARLAATGHKVVAVDLDIGGANLHTYFGVSYPQYTLADTIIAKRCSFGHILTPTGIEGLRLAAGGREEVWGGPQALDDRVMASLFAMLLKAKDEADADFLVLDLGAGTSRYTLDFFLAAHLAMVTVLPEPTSIENAYLFLKMGLFRLIDNVGARTGASDTAEAIKAALIMGDHQDVRPVKSGGYVERLKKLSLVHPLFIKELAQALSGRVVGITVNQVRSQPDIDVGKSMELIGQRYFGYQTRSCGYLNYDEAAWKSLRNRRLLMVDFPHSILARRMQDIAKSVLSSLGF